MSPLKGAVPRVALIVVNFHTEPEVLRLLDSIRAHPPFADFHLLLVDNAPERDFIFPLGPRDLYLPQAANIGFGPACNLAASRTEAKTIFLVNPDIEFTQGLDALLEEIRGDVAGVCPLISPPGFFQLRRLPTLPALAWDFLGLPKFFPQNRISRRYYYQPVPGQPFAVEQPAAAALLLDRRRFLDLGGFDPDFAPAWFEDVDLAFRIRARGWRLICDPRATLAHGLGVTARLIGRTAFFALCGRNGVRYFRKHHGRVQAFFVQVVFFWGFLLRALRGRVSFRLCREVWGW